MNINEAIEAVNAEPELPGNIPDEMWAHIKIAVANHDRDFISEMLRIVVRETKKGIIGRLTTGNP